MEVRDAKEEEIPQLASIWFDGWQDAHAEILPLALKQDRTRVSFETRLRSLLGSVRVIGGHGEPVGFSIVREDELYQLYVSVQAKGSGVAAALIRDAERRICESGARTAGLAGAIGNHRAARFYEKSGWQRVGTQVARLNTANGTFPLEVWRYEKELF